MSGNSEFRVAWRPDEFTEAKREFRGRIVRADWGSADPASPYYSQWVFPPEAPEDIRQRQVERKVIAVRIEIAPIDQAWENLYEWYTVSNVRQSKWWYFMDALHRLKAPFDTKGNTEPERLTNFCKSLLGMEFKWVDHENLPTAGRTTIKRILLPVEYYGKAEGVPEHVEI